MNDLKTWCISFCSLMIIIAVVRCVFPNCKMKSVAESVLSLIITVCMLMPFFNTENKYEFNFDTSEFSQVADENVQYEKALEKYIGDKLSENNIEFDNIEVYAYVDEDGYINIDSIIIKSKSVENVDETAEKIKSIVRNECKLDTEKVEVIE